jgi:pimeloyl-ACP methyl ester carboxylesterase
MSVFFIPFILQNSFAQTAPAAGEQIRYMKTGSGLEFGLWGGNSEKSPAPILFILASSIEETLGSEYFRQCGNRLARENGWLCVSLDVPYHGKNKKPGLEGLPGWVDAVKNGKDFVAENNNKMREILDFLITKGYADTSKIAVCGTSRGGYLGLQYAAVEPRVKSVAVFGPVADLAALREFADIKQSVNLKPFQLDSRIPKLAEKGVWIAIGDRDVRVGTDLTVQLARNISSLINVKNSYSRVELNVMYEPRGHALPVRSVDRAVEWILDKHSTPVITK